nr:hypothetical protein [Tanacetum cinerariifolium]GEY51443.1 hypothetical protein [Tanacetum cinerariifolium]GEY51450.1 hypothetical protein [Tanacetum cinerariifolium]
MTPSHFNTYQSLYNNPQFQQQFSPFESPQYGSIHPIQHYLTTYPSTPCVITYPSTPYLNAYSSTILQDAYPQPQSIPQIEYTVFIVNQQTHLVEFSQINFGLAVPLFKQGDDTIDAINKMMAFMSTVVTYRFPTINNQLRNSFNQRQQATIHDERVTVQPVQRRQSLFTAGTFGTKANISGTRGNNSGQQRVVKCFNCQREGHMVRQCLKPKSKRDATLCSDKVLLVKAQRSGKVMNEEELEFLVDLGVPEVLIDNLSSYGLDVLSEVPHFENTHNDMLNQSVQEMPDSKQTNLVNYPENEITNDSNIISYSQYLFETQNVAVRDTNSSSQQDAMILSMFDQLSNQVTNCNKVNKDNLIANESLSDEFEKYKERCFEIQKKEFWIKNDRLLDQIISQDIVNIVVKSSVDMNTSMIVNSSVVMNDYVNYVEKLNKCLELEAELIKQHNMAEKDEYNRLLKAFLNLNNTAFLFNLQCNSIKKFS